MGLVHRFAMCSLLSPLLASPLGCSGSEAATAAVATGVAVAATGVHRAATKDCWARCSKGYACNQKTGLCEPFECDPSCPDGTSCTIQATGATCMSTPVPLVNPVGVYSQNNHVRAANEANETRRQPATGNGALDRSEANRAGQVRIARGDPGPPTRQAPQSGKSSIVPAERDAALRQLGGFIYPQLETTLLEKWGPRLNDYSPQATSGAVSLAEQASVPFSDYILRMHDRLHPVYSQGWLGSLKELPLDHALRSTELNASIEIVLDGETGRVRSLGIVESSKIYAFNVAALEALALAGPFGSAPEEIQSGDGNVYLRWKLQSDTEYACAPAFAQPFLIR